MTTLSAERGTGTLVPMPTDWQRALAIVAHPDDLEYGASGAIAAWTAEGKEVTYLLATRGEEAGIAGMPPARCAAVREAEQRASAEIVGVTAGNSSARVMITTVTEQAGQRFDGRPAVTFELLLF